MIPELIKCYQFYVSLFLGGSGETNIFENSEISTLEVVIANIMWVMKNGGSEIHTPPPWRAWILLLPE